MPEANFLEPTDDSYRVISQLIDALLPDIVGTFTTEQMWQYMTGQGTMLTRKGKQNVCKKLNLLVERGILDRDERHYRKRNESIEVMDWVNADPDDIIPFKWPRGTDGTQFYGLELSTVYAGNIILVAGVYNSGKTAFLLNIIERNMDTMPTAYFQTENSPAELRVRLQSMGETRFLKRDGTPKFEAYTRYEDFQDVVKPDYLNVIDYISLEDRFFRIDHVLKKIRQRIGNGIAVVAIQKPKDRRGPNGSFIRRDHGYGGDFGAFLPRYYVALDYQKLSIVKCKAWRKFNSDGTENPDPNGTSYSFALERGGQFMDIRPELFDD